MGRKKLVNHRKLMKAIPDSHGVVSIIAKRLGVEWHTANNAIKNDPIAMQALQDEAEKIADVAETVILNALMQEDVRVAQWFLERKGTFRGFNPTIDIKNTSDTSITMNFIDKEGDAFDAKKED